MESNDLLKRTVTSDIPVLVEYTVTDYCQSFGNIILEMIKWGKAHREKIRSDRISEFYDTIEHACNAGFDDC